MGEQPVAVRADPYDTEAPLHNDGAIGPRRARDQDVGAIGSGDCR